jgi:hypothetical protein
MWPRYHSRYLEAVEAYRMEQRGIEPRPSPCKGDVLPLPLKPLNCVLLSEPSRELGQELLFHPYFRAWA